jgi:tagaturonate epimerase
MRQRYLGRSFEVEDLCLTFTQNSLARSAAKYGRALAHAAFMFHHLAKVMGSRAFEFEVSVDETETPTSPLEHFFVASELKRLGVRWVSLAPRYVGRFEKGVDYIGDLGQMDAELAQHAAIARALGPYKLSIHSGSDKFSVYPLFVRHAGSHVHLKTAGTSYLEALRAIAGVDPAFFREILAVARARYPEDRATYHVSAELDKVPRPEQIADEALAGVLDQFDGREVLHVTFGSVLDKFGDRLLDTLDAHEEAYYAALEAHFRRHLAAFV